jgi:hypothetical protein
MIKINKKEPVKVIDVPTNIPIITEICKHTLYNYKDLPLNVDDITYDELLKTENDNSKIIEKYNFVYKTNYVIKFLVMLKNMFNYY